MNVKTPRLRKTVEQLLVWLVSGDYGAIERYTGGTRMSAAALRESVSEYGRTLAMPPASCLDDIDAVEILPASPQAWSVRIALWTVEEGRSDLTLECTLIDQPGELLKAEVDDLHVL
jgi:hypothetical protein